MNKIHKPKISFSIADIPFGVSTHELFSLARDLKVDGVEVVVGVKTIPPLRKLRQLSEKYNVAILSVHQPLIPGFSFLLYESAIKAAGYFKASYVVHPPSTHLLFSEESARYFAMVNKYSQKYDVSACLENMPKEASMPILKYFIKRDSDSRKLLSLKKIAEKYDFFMTLDTSHIQQSLVHAVESMDSIFPLIKNIHLSDFTQTIEHLALGDGIMNVHQFMLYLQKNKYNGLITLELSPKLIVDKQKYLSDIEKSVKLVQKYLHD